MILTVIFRDDVPFIFVQASPSYRSVQIELTPDQCKSIECRYAGSQGTSKLYEEIDRCFIEPDSMPVKE